MRIFISGGCKNGKSYYAQRLAKEQQKQELYYIATMKPGDLEDEQRIQRHINDRRGWGFTTVEQYQDIDEILTLCDHCGSYLLDSVTALLANEMFSGGNVNDKAADKICNELTQLLDKLENIVVVSDYIFSDALQYDSLSEQYRSSLAQIDCMVANKCDVVIEVVYSNICIHKGGELFDLNHWGCLPGKT